MSGFSVIGFRQATPPPEEYDLGALEHQHNEPRNPSLGDRLNRATQSLRDTGGQLLADSLSQLPSARSMGAMAGTAAQQLITCGGTTLAREEVFMHAYHAMLPVLGEKAQWGLIGAQGAISLATVGANLYRGSRLDRLEDTSVNVRGHFGLSQDEWNAKSEPEKTELTNQHQTDSRNITRNQIAAEAAFFVMSSLSLAKGDGALAARVLATQLRNLTYAGSRETLQASMALTTSSNGTPSNGVNASNMAANGWTYTAMTLAAGYLQDAVIGRVLPAGQSVSGPALTNSQGKPLQGQELTDAIHLVAGIRGLANTAVEFMDAMRGKHYDLKQVGDEQKFQTDVTKMFPLKDYERLLDHSPARLSWNNISNATVLGASELAKVITHDNMPPGASQLLNNGGTAALFGLTYRMVNQSYQAHAKNRAAWKAEQTDQAQQTEGGTGVTVNAIPPDARTESALPPRTQLGKGSNGRGDTLADVKTPLPSSSARAPFTSHSTVEPSTSKNQQEDPLAGSSELRGKTSSSPQRTSLESQSASVRSRLESQNWLDHRAEVRAGKRKEVLPTEETPDTGPKVASETSSRPASLRPEPAGRSSPAPQLNTPQMDLNVGTDTGFNLDDEFDRVIKDNS
jgi:molybdopterin biosynthesis enzyme MoaB